MNCYDRNFIMKTTWKKRTIISIWMWWTYACYIFPFLITFLQRKGNNGTIKKITYLHIKKNEGFNWVTLKMQRSFAHMLHTRSHTLLRLFLFFVSYNIFGYLACVKRYSHSNPNYAEIYRVILIWMFSILTSWNMKKVVFVTVYYDMSAEQKWIILLLFMFLFFFTCK